MDTLLYIAGFVTGTVVGVLSCILVLFAMAIEGEDDDDDDG